MPTLHLSREKTAAASLAGLILFFSFSAVYAAEIKVQLFGQPCLLTDSDPSATTHLTETQLKTIHTVSPEQLPPPTSADEARKLKTKILSAGKLPTSLDRYRDLILKRIDGLLAFFQAASKFKQNKNTTQLLTALKPHLNEKRVKNLEREMKKYEGKTTVKITEPMLEEMRDYYEENSNFPATTVEEEFHRAIARINVRYQCTFEEISEEGDDENDEAE